MAVTNYLATRTATDLQVLHKRPRSMGETVTYRGAVRHHPYDNSKIILIVSPMEASHRFFEFRLEDILSIDDVQSQVAATGETVRIVDLDVRVGAHAIEMRPFEVFPDA